VTDGFVQERDLSEGVILRSARSFSSHETCRLASSGFLSIRVCIVKSSQEFIGI